MEVILLIQILSNQTCKVFIYFILTLLLNIIFFKYYIFLLLNIMTEKFLEDIKIELCEKYNQLIREFGEFIKEFLKKKKKIFKVILYQ